MYRTAVCLPAVSLDHAPVWDRVAWWSTRQIAVAAGTGRRGRRTGERVEDLDAET
jgi:hypothetical protein